MRTADPLSIGTDGDDDCGEVLVDCRFFCSWSMWPLVDGSLFGK